MKEFEQNQRLIRQYLLGELDEEAREQIEERFIVDSEYQEAVLIIESELLENYLIDDLSHEARARFLQHYLSTPRQIKKLKRMEALLKAASSTKRSPAKIGLLASLKRLFYSKSPQLQFATVSLIVLVLIAAGVSLRVWHLRNQKAELSAELTRMNTPENIVAEDSTVLALTLLPVTLRDKSALPKITLTPTAKVLQLRLPGAPDTYPTYRIELHTVEGDQLAEFEAKAQGLGQALILQLPARILKANDYVVTVRGLTAERRVENIGDFSFRVLQQ